MYRRIEVHSDLKWHAHIEHITARELTVLGFVKRTIPLQSVNWATAYKQLTRPVLEYACCSWDPLSKHCIQHSEDQSGNYIASDEEAGVGNTRRPVPKPLYVHVPVYSMHYATGRLKSIPLNFSRGRHVTPAPGVMTSSTREGTNAHNKTFFATTSRPWKDLARWDSLLLTRILLLQTRLPLSDRETNHRSPLSPEPSNRSSWWSRLQVPSTSLL